MILVTGGTGFLGAHLLYHLVNSGKSVRALKRIESYTNLTEKIFSYYSEDPQQLFNKIDWVEGDILDYDSLVDAFSDIDYLYHTAAVVSFHSNDKHQLIRTNIDGTANVVNAAIEQNVKKLCYVSSIGALGREDATGLVNEETPYRPSSKSSVYGKSKYEAEREVWRGMAEGLDAVIVNPSIIVGPGEWRQGSSQMFQTMWNGLKFYTSGTNGFIDVNDVANAMIVLMEGEYSNERFVLSSENVGYKQFFEWMADAMGIARPKYKAGPILSNIGSIALKIKGLVSDSNHTITRETARTANQKYQYSSGKFLKATRMSFIPVKESVEKTTRFFLRDFERSYKTSIQ